MNFKAKFIPTRITDIQFMVGIRFFLNFFWLYFLGKESQRCTNKNVR